MSINIKVHIYSPIQNKVTNTILFGNSTSGGIDDYPEYKGGDEELFISDDIFETALEDTNDIITGDVSERKELATKTQSELLILPEDNLMDLRQKIYVETGIPLYRQHLFYEVLDKYRCGYKLYANGLVNTDIRKLFDQKTDKILDVPIDMELYKDRDIINVKAYDTMTIIQNEGVREFYIVDLEDIITMSNVINEDRYSKIMFYWGFIVKYFPILTYDVFTTYVDLGEKELVQYYPLLNKDPTSLKNLYIDQQNLLNRKPIEKIDIAVLRAYLTPNDNDNVNTNIRNLFDVLSTSHSIPYIRAYFTIQNKNYMLEKTFRGINQPKIPKYTVFNDGLTMVCIVPDRTLSAPVYINITPNKPPTVIMSWHEEDHISFNNISKQVHAHITPIFKEINKYSLYIGGKISEFYADNIEYTNITNSIIWNKTLYDADMKKLLDTFKKYVSADIIDTRNTQHGMLRDELELVIKKGVFNFNDELIQLVVEYSNLHKQSEEINNYYDYLTNTFVRQKWDQIYQGKIFNIRNKIVYIQFMFYDLTKEELPIIKKILSLILEDANISEQQQSGKTARMLAKFNNEDPELYNLKRHGLPTVYARYCQGKMQPEMASKYEYDNMDDKKNWVKYWNFTKQEPAYYKCVHDEYPYLSFRVNIHPKGYCLPCCKKKAGDTGKGLKIQEQCLNSYTFTDEETDLISRYIMQYSDDVNVSDGRLMYLPGSLSEALVDYKIEINSQSSETDYTIYVDYDSSSDNLIFNVPRRLINFINIADDDNFTFSMKVKSGYIKYVPNTIGFFNKNVEEKKQLSVFSSRDKEESIVKLVYEIAKNEDILQIGCLNFSNMILIAKEHKYEVHTIYRRLDGMAYGALLRKNGEFVYCAIYPSEINYVNYIKGTVISDKAFARDHAKIEAKNTYKLIDQINKLFDFKITEQMCKGKNVRTIIVNNTYMFHVTHGNVIGDCREMEFDPCEVNRQILEQKSPEKDNRVKHIDKALYYNYSYQLLLLEILYKINQEENTKLRTKLKTILEDKKMDIIDKNRKIITMDEIPDIDKSIIVSILGKLYFSGKEIKSKELSEYVLTDKYQFDRKTLTKLMGMEFNERRKELDKIAKSVITFGKFSGKMDNIYTPCGYTYSDYCKGKKLIVDKSDYEKFIDIITNDIVNPIKFDHMVDNLWIENIIQYFKFNVRDHEDIIIRLL